MSPLSRVYPIVDCAIWVRRLLAVGARLIQLRVKERPTEQIRQEIRNAKAVCANYNAQLVVNDYWELAVAEGCDYVHLGQTDLWARFAPHVYSVVEVARGKPAPDLFLHAAARLGIAPARCLVVEDSVAGVQAAVAAGMTAFGFCGGGHCGSGHAQRLEAAGAVASFVDIAACGVALRDALGGS